MLNEQGYVAECTGDNIFLLTRDGGWRTPSIASGALDGITRRTVMELIASEGQAVQEGLITRFDLYTAEEVFLTGTAAEVTPVRDIDGVAVGAGTRGPVVERIQSAYRDAVTGRLPGFERWLTPYSA